MKDGLQNAASFASLTNWGRHRSYVVRRMERKSKMEVGLGGKKTQTNTQIRGSGIVTRLHNFQHLLAMIDKSRGEKVMVRVVSHGKK